MSRTSPRRTTRGRTRDAVLLRLLRHARFEVMPTVRIEDAVVEHLAPGATVTVTASPAKGLEATLALTESLAARGYDAVPHLAARAVRGPEHLREVIARMTAAGVRTVFVPAGDTTPPEGPYAGAVDLLDELAALGRPFAGVGVTGYPESHPTIGDDLTVQAMWDKRHHATEIVSNLTLDPRVVEAWLHRVRGRGVTTPVLLGLPGPVERTKLAAMATKIGVGESARFLAKNRRVLARLAAPGGYDPLELLGRLAPVLAEEGTNVRGLHLFTFNQVAETEAWRRRQVALLEPTIGS